MGRRKVRYYKDREFYKNLFDEYFDKHHAEVMAEVLRQTGFEDSTALSVAEHRMYFGLDCGWILLTPKNKDHAHEWFLDNDRISSYMFVHNKRYNCQSTTIAKIMVEKAVRDLGLEDTFYISVRLD